MQGLKVPRTIILDSRLVSEADGHTRETATGGVSGLLRFRKYINMNSTSLYLYLIIHI